MYHRIGDYDKSKKCHEDCLAIAKKLEDQSLEAGALHSLGMIEQDRGNYDEAKKLYNESLEISQKLGDQSGIATTLHQLGRLAEIRGNLDPAETLYEQAPQICKNLGLKRELEIVRKSLESVRRLKQKT